MPVYERSSEPFICNDWQSMSVLFVFRTKVNLIEVQDLIIHYY